MREIYSRPPYTTVILWRARGAVLRAEICMVFSNSNDPDRLARLQEAST